MIAAILKAAVEAIERGRGVAIATVIVAQGSSPGRPGHKMLIHADGRTEGTVGGGKLEHLVLAEARAMLLRGQGGILTYSFDPNAPNATGMVCGGSATIAVEVVAPRARVLLCGGGHVAQALALQFAELGFVHSVVDERPEIAARTRFPGAAEIVCESPPDYIARVGLEDCSHVICVTHEHKLDERTVLAIAKSGFDGYVGMIGSQRKWATVRAGLEAAAIDPQWIKTIRCPIGLAIGARTPAEIAISITAEMVREMNTRA